MSGGRTQDEEQTAGNREIKMLLIDYHRQGVGALLW